MGVVLAQAVIWFADLLILLLLARAVLSWFVRDPYSTLGKVYQMTIRLSEPIVAPCRQLISRWNTGMFDFSVLLAFFLIEIVERILLIVIGMIF